MSEDPTSEELRRLFSKPSPRVEWVKARMLFEKFLNPSTESPPVTTPKSSEKMNTLVKPESETQRKRQAIHVHLRPREFVQVGETAARIFYQEGVRTLPQTYPDRAGSRRLNIKRNILEAFKGLPEGRRPTAAGSTVFQRCYPYVLTAFTKLLETPPAPPAPEPPAVMPKVEDVIPPAPYLNGNGIHPSTTPPAPAPQAEVGTLSDFIHRAGAALETAIRSMETRLSELERTNAELIMPDVDGIRNRWEQLEARVRGLEKDERREVAEEKAKLPRVAVLGCRKDEFDIVAKAMEEAGIKLDLRLYEQDTKPRPIQADWAVMMKFINHAWNDHVLKAVPAGHWSFVRGGTQQVINQLTAWFI